MRLAIQCKDPLSVIRELITLFAAGNIALRSIETGNNGTLYLDCFSVDTAQYQPFIADILRIEAVIDVQPISYLPSQARDQRINYAMASLTDAIVLIDAMGKITMANRAALALFDISEKFIQGRFLSEWVSGYSGLSRLNTNVTTSFVERLPLFGQDYIVESTPISLPLDRDDQPSEQHVVVVLRSVAKITHQLQLNVSRHDDAFTHIVAVSDKMKRLIEQASKIALLDAPLLIIGDTGTGKDILAKACHHYSRRRDKPFLGLNCASLPDDVVESELFGHGGSVYPTVVESKKGFFEQANGGSVLLDNICEMSPTMQTKLLRFLNDGTFRRVGEDQEVHVDVRIICATQKNLSDLVSQGLFREDLYYRLNVLTLAIPPLHERVDDIMPLALQFIRQFADELGIVQPKVSADVTPLLTQYRWPGNVRQLKNVLYRSVTQLSGEVLRAEDIVLPAYAGESMLSQDTMNGTLDEISKRFERAVLIQLYSRYPSTRKLAKRLGVSHTAIANKLREYGINQSFRASESEQD